MRRFEKRRQPSASTSRRGLPRALCLAIVVLVAEVIGQTALAGTPQRLWVADAEWSARRRAILESPLSCLVNDAQRVLDETATLGMTSALRGLPATRDEILNRLQALTVQAAFHEDQRAAAEAADWVEGLLINPRGSDLGRAHSALHAAVAFAFCRPHLQDETCERLARRFYDYGLTLRRIGEGNPDNPFNNWWGVTHSGAGLCFLAAADRIPAAGAELELEKERVGSYLGNYGDEGHYYEGTGYGLYSFSFWGPFLLACEARDGADIARHAPGARRVGCATHTLTVPAGVAVGGELGEAERLGRRVFWNDDGDHFCDPSIACLFPVVAPPEAKDWLEAANARVCGTPLSRRIAVGHGHAMWPLLFAPLHPTAPYGVGAPRALYDKRTGLVVFRNRYCDANDTVFAVYAKSFHGGGHWHEDAGSFRLLSLGSGWAYAGGQAQPAARFQNVPLLKGERDQPVQSRVKTGKVSYYATDERGGSVSVDLSDVYGVPRCRRHFAIVFPESGVEAVVAVWDEISAPEENVWAWSLCYEPTLECQLVGDGRFTLSSPQGSWMTGAIGGAGGLELENLEGEPSTRTFSEGTRRDYPGSRYLLADLGAFDKGTLAVLAVGKGPAPITRFEGEGYGLTARVGTDLLIELGRSRWYNGPLRILGDTVEQRPAVKTSGLQATPTR